MPRPLRSDASDKPTDSESLPPPEKTAAPASLTRARTAQLAGHAQNDLLEGSSATSQAQPTPSEEKYSEEDMEDDDDSENYRKLYNRMDAKLRRLCMPKAKSGKIEADPILVRDWKMKGHTRTQLVKLMIESHGDKDMC